MNLKHVLAGILFILPSLALIAQVDDDFEKFKQDYDKGIEALRDDYRKYVEQADKEFSEYLKNDWEQFQLFKAMSADEMPGPQKIPVYKKMIQVEPVRVIQPAQITREITSETMVVPPRTAIPADEKRKPEIKSKAVSFSFYGVPVALNLPLAMCEKFSQPVNEANIAKYWEKMCATDHNQVLGEILKLKNTTNLNDYALLQFTTQIAQKSVSDDNTAKLLTWFMLTKMGYKTKIGYQNQKIYLLIPSVNQVYGYNYYTFEGLKYYVFDENPGTLFTYAGNYQSANQIMNFNLYKSPLFPVDTASRNLKFSYNGVNYSFDILYNKNLIEFYKAYPQCNISLYFDAGISDLSLESLAKQLWPIVHRMDEKDAAAFLLKMVQTAFEYKTDQEQFGKEKYFFAEEILHYPAADCEDRSVFFAFLVNEFLQLPVISLCYPLHIATAVNFSNKAYGDVVEYKGSVYTVCDPTYINAPIGATMPEFKKSKFSVVAPEKRLSETGQPEFVWEKIYNAGGIRTGSSSDLIYLKDNSYVVSGIFRDSLQLGATTYNNNKETTGLFVAAYDKRNNLIWLNTMQFSGNFTPDGMATDSMNNIYLTGQFTGTISAGNRSLKAKSGDDQFVLKMDVGGKMQWLTGVALDTVSVAKPYAFQCLISENGEVQGFHYVREYTWDESISIYHNDNNAIVITTERSLSEARYSFGPEFGSSGSYELVEAWKKLTDQYVSMRYNKSIAGFFALMETLENANLDIGGKEILATLNTLNPSFKNDYKGFYTSLQALSRLSSRNGIVSFYTNNGQVLKCGPLSITNGAQAQMRDYKSGNKQVKTLKGIYYDTLFRSLSVNYIKFFKVNGDLMIDYSRDHYQKVVNTEKDILRQ